MALTRSTIDSSREQVNYCKNYSSVANRELSSAKANLSANSNYQTFVQGTEIGNTLNEKLNKLIDLANSINDNEMNNLIIKANAFLETQELLNKGQ